MNANTIPAICDGLTFSRVGDEHGFYRVHAVNGPLAKVSHNGAVLDFHVDKLRTGFLSGRYAILSDAEVVQRELAAMDPTYVFSTSMWRMLEPLADEHSPAWYSAMQQLSYVRFSIADIGVFDAEIGDESEYGIVNVCQTRNITVEACRYGTIDRSAVKRTPMKLGRVLWSIVDCLKREGHDAPSDAETASLVDAFKARNNQTVSFDVVDGADIVHWYNERTYDTDEPTYSLAASCMRHSYCADFLDIYAENPEKVALVIATRGDRLIGRALLWRLDNGGYYLDRQYGRDETQKAIVNFARSRHDDLTVYGSGLAYSATLAVTLKHYDFREYPYMDTLAYLSMETGTLQDGEPNGLFRELKQTDGSYDESDREECAYCGRSVPNDETSYVEAWGVVCDRCIERYFSRCDQCDELLHDDYISYIPSSGNVCESCLEDNFFTCPCCHETLPLDAETDGGICEDCRDNGAYECADCGNWVISADADDLAHHCQLWHREHTCLLPQYHGPAPDHEAICRMTGRILSTWDMEQLAHHWKVTQRAYGCAMMEVAHA